MSAESLQGWTPVRLYQSPEGPMVDWCRLGPARCTKSFFEQTVTETLRSPARMLFRRQTPAAVLENLDTLVPGIPPTAFVYHLSRCGSTLVAQMLASSPRNLVLSEPPPIDQVLGGWVPNDDATHSRRIAWLRGMVRALAQPRAGESRCFIKFDSWHTLALPLIHAAFPDVPWIFLYRDPVEVLVSQQRQRGTQMIPGVMNPQFFGLDPATAQAMSLDEYGAHVLACIGDAALRFRGLGRGRLVNYRQLPAVLGESLGRFFGADFSPDELDRMRRASLANAKTPGLSYTDDTAAKQREATDQLRELAARHLAGIYAQSEALRLANEP
jgi:hypothetical protein